MGVPVGIMSPMDVAVAEWVGFIMASRVSTIMVMVVRWIEGVVDGCRRSWS